MAIVAAYHEAAIIFEVITARSLLDKQEASILEFTDCQASQLDLCQFYLILTAAHYEQLGVLLAMNRHSACIQNGASIEGNRAKVDLLSSYTLVCACQESQDKMISHRELNSLIVVYLDPAGR